MPFSEGVLSSVVKVSAEAVDFYFLISSCNMYVFSLAFAIILSKVVFKPGVYQGCYALVIVNCLQYQQILTSSFESSGLSWCGFPCHYLLSPMTLKAP